MASDEPVELVSSADRREADPTSAMVREEGIDVEGLWAGLVRTRAHMASGWHHHGDHETAIYVIEGSVRMEFGPNGEESLEAGPGDFLRVPKQAVHRESNPEDREGRFVVVRAGSGPTTIAVPGPAGPAGSDGDG